MAAESIAANSNQYPAVNLPSPLYTANISTRLVPKIAHAQNCQEGFCLKYRLAHRAVASGNIPVTTAACAEFTSRNASAKKIGKPTTVPNPLIVMLGHNSLGGS